MKSEVAAIALQHPFCQALQFCRATVTARQNLNADEATPNSTRDSLRVRELDLQKSLNSDKPFLEDILLFVFGSHCLAAMTSPSFLASALALSKKGRQSRCWSKRRPVLRAIASFSLRHHLPFSMNSKTNQIFSEIVSLVKECTKEELLQLLAKLRGSYDCNPDTFLTLNRVYHWKGETRYKCTYHRGQWCRDGPHTAIAWTYGWGQKWIQWITWFHENFSHH